MKNECWGIVLADGTGSGMPSSVNGESIPFLCIENVPLWWITAEKLAASPLVHGLVIVFPEKKKREAEQELAAMLRKHSPGVPVAAAAGGERWQDSVFSGLKTLPPSCEIVLVQDSARPLASTALATRMILALMEHPGMSGVLPGIAVESPVARTDADGLCLGTAACSDLRTVQTPQVFRRHELEDACGQAGSSISGCTDGAMLLQACGKKILVAGGESENIKITRPDELRSLLPASPAIPCCGYGYDVHAFGGNRPLRLGGVLVSEDITVAAHSDGDVLLHALTDAILGCFDGGDIGRLFPDSDPLLDNASSIAMLDHVLELAADAGVRIVHADLTVITQIPKLSPFSDEIRTSVARLLSLPLKHVGFKATTEEHLGFTGEKKGIKAAALVSALHVSGDGNGCPSV